VSSLKEKYNKQIAPAMSKMFGYANTMQVPRVSKVVVSRGVGDAVADAKAIKVSQDELTLITGQLAATRKAKISIANFKLKKGTPIGALVTLRGGRMYDFLNKLINVCLPKIRDFKGFSPNSFDGNGNFNLGLKEQLIFPEIDYDKVDKVRGMNVTIVTTAKTDDEARELLVQMGVPFRK
jgi:large subunit ribosomal protein L5